MPRPTLAARIAQAQTRQRSPFAMFTRAVLLGWATGALLRGNIGVVLSQIEHDPFAAGGIGDQDLP
jgi:hypothetical protein